MNTTDTTRTNSTASLTDADVATSARARRIAAIVMLGSAGLGLAGGLRNAASAAPAPGGPVVVVPVSPSLPVGPIATIPPLATIPLITIPTLVTLPPIVTFATKNVSVKVTNGVTQLAPNDNVVSSITVRNHWSDPVSGINVLAGVPAGVTGTVWSCTVGAGSSCGGSSTGSGAINRSITLAPGSAAVFTVSAVVTGATPQVAQNVTVVPPVSLGDIDATDNTASDVDAVITPATVAPAATTTVPAPTTVPVVTVPPTTVPAPTTAPSTAPAPTSAPTTAPTATPQTVVVIIKQETATAKVKKSAKKVVKKSAKKVSKKGRSTGARSARTA